MRPALFPDSGFRRSGDAAEARFFRALELAPAGPIGIHCIEVVGESGAREADFLVVDEEFGCKLIEVKAWSRILGPHGTSKVRFRAPRFAEAAFEVTGGRQSISVRLQYFGGSGS